MNEDIPDTVYKTVQDLNSLLQQAAQQGYKVDIYLEQDIEIRGVPLPFAQLGVEVFMLVRERQAV